MFNTPIIEIILGLILIFFFLSILVAIINEMLTTLLVNLRGRMLKEAIQEMLGGSVSLTTAFYKNALIKSMSHYWKFSGSKKSRKPSYLSSATFSAVLIKILDIHSSVISVPPDSPEINNSKTNIPISTSIKNIRNNKEIIKDDVAREKIADLLETLYVACLNEPERFPAKIEEWFNETMERVSGWYKRRMKVLSFCVGFVLVVFINADTLSVIRYLQTNPESRIEMMAVVDKLVKDTTYQDQIVSDTSLNKLYNRIIVMANDDLNNLQTLAGMGWNGNNVYRYFQKSSRTDIVNKIIGWLITAVALTLGAPFWFDLLNKISKLRGAGTVPPPEVQSKQITPPGP